MADHTTTEDIVSATLRQLGVPEPLNRTVAQQTTELGRDTFDATQEAAHTVGYVAGTGVRGVADAVTDTAHTVGHVAGTTTRVVADAVTDTAHTAGHVVGAGVRGVAELHRDVAHGVAEGARDVFDFHRDVADNVVDGVRGVAEFHRDVAEGIGRGVGSVVNSAASGFMEGLTGSDTPPSIGKAAGKPNGRDGSGSSESGSDYEDAMSRAADRRAAAEKAAGRAESAGSFGETLDEVGAALSGIQQTLKGGADAFAKKSSGSGPSAPKSPSLAGRVAGALSMATGLVAAVDAISRMVLDYSIVDRWVRKPFAGDWDAMAESSTTWIQISQDIAAMCDEISQLPASYTDTWTGEAADAYTAGIQRRTQLYVPVADAAESLAHGLTVLAELAGTILDIVMNSINLVVGILSRIAAEVASVVGAIIATVEILNLVRQVVVIATDVFEAINSYQESVALLESVAIAMQATANELHAQPV